MGTKLSSFLQWKSNIFLYRLLGWKIAFNYITFIGTLYYLFKRKEKLRIEATIDAVFSGRKNSVELKALKRRIFRGIRSHYYEKLFNAFSTGRTLKAFFASHVEGDGLNLIDEGLAKGRGVLLITGHIGGVEFIPGYLSANNYPVTIIARFSSDHLRRISEQKAEQFNARLIEPTRTPNVIKAILANLKENRIVITQCDEVAAWRPSRDITIDFLGRCIHLDKTLNILIKRAKSAITFGIMHRDDQHLYRFVVTSREDMSARISNSDGTTTGGLILKFLERYIYDYPQQWYQWQKYAEIEAHGHPDAPGAGRDSAVPMPFLNPPAEQAA